MNTKKDIISGSDNCWVNTMAEAPMPTFMATPGEGEPTRHFAPSMDQSATRWSAPRLLDCSRISSTNGGGCHKT
jgi:hypothetical protein